MDAKVAELARGLRLRSDAFGELIRDLRGPLGKSRDSLRRVLDLAELVPGHLETAIEEELSRGNSVSEEASALQGFLRYMTMLLDFAENHLSHGTRRELSQALVDEIQAEFVALGLGDDYSVVVSHGSSRNYYTDHGDLREKFFNSLFVSETPPLPSTPYACFKVPRFEGTAIQWRPILLGHEVAHVASALHEPELHFDLDEKWVEEAVKDIEFVPGQRPDESEESRAQRLFAIAASWTTELICDAHALRQFGPAAVTALAEYFTYVGSMDLCKATHPPGSLRIQLLLSHLGGVDDARIEAMLAPWRPVQGQEQSYEQQWVRHLGDLFVQHADSILRAAERLPSPRYDHRARLGWIHGIADSLADGVPGRELMVVDGRIEMAQAADVINAAWIARAEDSHTPFDQLAQKTLESISFVNEWQRFGGELPVDLLSRIRTVSAGGAGEPIGSTSAILPAAKLVERLITTEADRRLVVSPLLQEPKDSGMDLRLGRRFIVFRRTGTTDFDPLDTTNDPRSVQSYVELANTERFVLHPQEIVLGATMEYLVMPRDASGQVITRSSYGRLGLLTATAVQVHAGFRGCLTLELANLSTIPITLTPGERIAQLVLWQSAAGDEQARTYRYAVGPEFSLVRKDDESRVLNSMREVRVSKKSRDGEPD